MMQCRICQNIEDNKPVELNGTMYGTRGKFDYFICSKCGCLQIKEFPADLSAYYNNDSYYSFNMDRRKFRNELLFRQMIHQLNKRHSLLGAIVQWIYPVNYEYFNLVSVEDSILDIGCGDGELIRWLNRAGYKNVLGIDPYLNNEIISENKVIAVKGDIVNYNFGNKKFKMVTMIHSFEHVYNNREVLKAIDNILEQDGYLVIQLPGFSNYYWKEYGNKLYTLDPPRHQYIYTQKSLNYLMKEMNYELVSYETEIDVAIPGMAKNIENNEVEKNVGTSFISGTMVSLLSKSLRRRLKRENDGAIITAVYRKNR